jgi:hypothetical protein
MITEKNHKLLTSQLFVTDCTKKGLASMVTATNKTLALINKLSFTVLSKLAKACCVIPVWFCFAHIKQQIVSLFRSDLISVCIFFNIEQILSGSTLLTGITQQALANLDKTVKLSLFIKAFVIFFSNHNFS